MNYVSFLHTKKLVTQQTGKDIDESEVNAALFPFQKAIVRWAVRKGRCAIFADTGLGKTLMQLEWARLTGGRSLIVAPLQVANQTVQEAKRFGLDVTIGIDRSGKPLDGITVTNYEQSHKFSMEDFDSVVLDESSILKSIDGKMRGRLIEQCGIVKNRLCCTATPAPNDITEIANHAEFLGVMKRVEMLASFFVHDQGTKKQPHAGWRLKGHASDSFYRWLASWAMSVRKPSDIGFSDDGYSLPDLKVNVHEVNSDYRPPGELFFVKLKGIQERTKARRETIEDRLKSCLELVNSHPDQAIVWCGLNDESRLLAKSIEGSVEVVGSDRLEEKIEKLQAFISGEKRVLITKSKIAGFGMNFQHCHRMIFFGLNDSWEGYYQSIRRCWRFGQSSEVTVDIVISNVEFEIYENVMRKEAMAIDMSKDLIEHVSLYEREELEGVKQESMYRTDSEVSNAWSLLLGDSAERMAAIEPDSIDLSVFSPPFSSLYTYSPTERDLGNCRSEEEFFVHFSFVIDELFRVTKPGRLVCCHCQQLPQTKMYDGQIGLKDFRGSLIRAFVSGEWIYHGEVCIDKDPQAQAIRTKARGLLFVTKNTDSSWCRPAFADYILIFRKPGENQVPIVTDVTNEEWIEFARPIWYGIRESHTLTVAEGRDQKDEKHICPLQLETIERCVRLWSNPGETVLSPFAGIGSEGYASIKLGRKFIGIELKESYYKAALKNLRRAEESERQRDIFEKAPEVGDDARPTS